MPWITTTAALLPMVAASALPAGLAGDTHACDGGPAVLVRVVGLKDRTGQVRVELYPGTDEDFLAPRKVLRAQGKLFKRIDTPVPPHGAMQVCVSLPGAGRYTLSVLHDRNLNGKLDLFKDGYGFPNNPKLGFGKPPASTAAFTASAGVTTLDIRLNYWNGIGARPLRGAD